MAGEVASIPAVTLDQATALKSIEEAIAEYKIDDEFKALIPPLSKDELATLKESISKDGCLGPLIIWKGQGIILDGHNRYQICRDLGVPFKVVEIDLPDRTAAKIWMLHHQRGRRNLNEAQRAMLAVKLEALYAEKAKERQGLRTDLDQNLDQSDAGRSAEKAAKDMGVSHQTVSFAKKVTIKGVPGLVSLAESGKVAVSAAARVTSLDEESQVRIVERIEAEIGEGKHPKIAAIIREVAPEATKDASDYFKKASKNLKACLGHLESIEGITDQESLAEMKEAIQKIVERLKLIGGNPSDPSNKEAVSLSSDDQAEIEEDSTKSESFELASDKSDTLQDEDDEDSFDNPSYSEEDFGDMPVDWEGYQASIDDADQGEW